MIISCRKAALLASKKLDDKLSWLESIELVIHKQMCNWCKRYSSQITEIHDNVKGSKDLSHAEHKLSNNDKNKLENALKSLNDY